MKKLFLSFLLLIISYYAGSQKIDSTLSKTKIGYFLGKGGITCEFGLIINIENKDTTKYKYILLAFQNAEYYYITDIVLIHFNPVTERAEISEFLNDLRMALSEMKKKKKQNISWNRKKYSLYLSDPIPSLRLIETKSNGYMWLHKRQAEKLIAWLEDVGLKLYTEN